MNLWNRSSKRRAHSSRMQRRLSLVSAFETLETRYALATVLGTGTAALIDGDLTDPDNNGNPELNSGYNATFAASSEADFGGGENAFNVFDNQVGGGNAKWCCQPTPQWVQADFGEPNRYILNKFTVTSSNDSPGRDPLNWSIQGSNDGSTFTTIFTSNGTNYWASGIRDQVIRFDAGTDFTLPTTAYRIFRMQVDSVVAPNALAIGEIEFFGQPTVVYVDDNFSGAAGATITDADLGTTGDQSASLGINAFTTISAAVAAVADGGTIIVNGGSYNETVNLTGSRRMEVTGPNAAQTVTIAALEGDASAIVVLEGSSTLVVGDATNRTFAGTISGSGALTKQGAGALSLTNAGSSYSGQLTVAEGTLRITNWNNKSANGPLGNSAAPVILGGTSTMGTLEYAGAASNAPSTLKGLQIASGGGKVQLSFIGGTPPGQYVHLNGSSLTGAGPLTVDTSNAGVMTSRFILVGPSTFSGNITVNASTQLQTNSLVSGDTAAFGVGPTGTGPAITMNSGSILDLYAGNTAANSPTILIGSLAGTGVVQGESAGNYTVKIGGDNTSTTFSGVISGANGATSMAVTKVGTGTLTLTGANTYTGVTQINAGTLKLGNAAALGTTAGATQIRRVDDANRGTLDLNGFTISENLSFEDQGTAGTTLGSGGFLVNSSATQAAVNGTTTINKNATIGSPTGTQRIQLNGVVSGSANLLVQEGAFLFLNSANPGFTGATSIITAGLIQMLNVNGLQSTASVSVANGTTLDLAASGNYAAVPTSIAGAGAGGRGALRVGNGAVWQGAVTLTDNATINQGFTNGTGTISGNIGQTGGSRSLTIGLNTSTVGTIVLSGNNSYTGSTTISAATLRLGSASALPATTVLAMSGAAVLDLNGNNASVVNVSSSVNTATIIDNSGVAGTTVFTVSNQSSTISSLIKDGPTRKLAVEVANANGGVTMFALANQNTFSGGLTLLHTGGGTRLVINGAVSTTGAPGSIVSGPFGRGAISIGKVATDKAGIYFTAANATLANDIIFNTALGTDRVGIRSDTTGIVLSGKITANLAPATFSTNGTGAFALTGQLTGAGGLTLSNAFGSSLQVTLNNQTANANNYLGPTIIAGTINKLTLGAANQIPATTNLTASGTLDLNGNSTAVATLAGSGTITDNSAVAGTSTFTVNAATGQTYSGVINNGATRPLALVVNNPSSTGDLILTGASNYSGGTTLNSGRIRPQASTVGSPGSIVTGPLGRGLVTVNSTNPAANAGGQIFFATAATLANAFAVAGRSGEGFGAIRLDASATLSGPITLTGNTRFGNANGNPVLTLAGPVSGAFDLELRKGNVGSFTMLLNNGPADANVTVQSGATLGGSGTIQGNVSVSGTLSPGMTPGAAGALAIGGNLALLAGSNYVVDVASGAIYDSATATNITIDPAANLVATVATGIAEGSTIILLDATTNVTGLFTLGTASAAVPGDRLVTFNGTEIYHLTNGDTPADRFATVGPTQVALVRNRGMQAEPNSYTMLQNTALTGNVLTDVDDPAGLDVDLDTDAVVVLVGSAPNTATQGTLSLASDGSFTFTPIANFKGIVTFSYKLFDGEKSSDTVLVTINVTNVALDANGNLQVSGNTSDDRIIIQPAVGGKISVRFNNALSPSFTVDPGNKVIVHGNAGNDTISVSGSIGVPVEFYGGEGNDYLAGGSLDDILDGGSGSDRLLAGAGNDLLLGGSGNDTLGGGLGSDTIYGDSYLDENSIIVTPLLDSEFGRDTISGEGGDDFLYGEGNNDTINGGLGSDLLRGGDGSDTLSGDDGHDALSGDAGNDKLYGRAGNDVLIGGEGADLLYGGTGHDLLFGNSLDNSEDTDLEDIYSDWFLGDFSSAAGKIEAAPRSAETLMDSLYGETGDDWYLLYFGDKIATTTDKAPANTIENITP